MYLPQAKKTVGSNSIARTPSMTGKSYPTDVMVMSVQDEDKSFIIAVDDLVKVLHHVSTNDNCRQSWNFSL